MSKHTPAPWTVNPKAKTNIRHGSLTIANCSSTHDGSRVEEEIANVNPFAAAPELLEALQFCQSVIKAQGMFDLSERMAYDKAEAAIVQILPMVGFTCTTAHHRHTAK